MFCSHCGSEIKLNSSFCANCGARQPQDQSGQDAGLNQQGDGAYQQSPGYPPQGQSYPPHGPGVHPPGSNLPGSNPGASTPPAPRGKTMLYVAGIILTVFSAIAVVSSLAFLASADYWDNVMPIASGMSWSVYYAISTFSSIYSLIIGIVAIKLCNQPEKADLLKVLGIIAIVGVVIWNIFAFRSGALAAVGFAGLSVISMPIDLILPILYVVGAQKNLESLRMSQSDQQN